MLFPRLQEIGNLVAFRSPGLAIARTFIQLVGEFDFEDTFKEGTLLYSPAAYILFFTFLITMPILFTNFLVSCHQYAMCLDNLSQQTFELIFSTFLVATHTCWEPKHLIFYMVEYSSPEFYCIT